MATRIIVAVNLFKQAAIEGKCVYLHTAETVVQYDCLLKKQKSEYQGAWKAGQDVKECQNQMCLK